MNIETACLILKTCNLAGDAINADKSSFLWRNINMRILLGTMYDKFDYFNLSLKTMAIGVPTTDISDDQDNLGIILYCSGLPFVNQTYDASKGVTINTPFGSAVFASLPKHEDYYDNRTLTFSKNQDMCNFNIFYKTTAGDLKPTVELGPFPDAVFIFEIIGIPKEDGNKNGTRMF